MSGSPAKPLPVVVLISGGGTTLKNLLAKMATEQLGIKILRVVSSNAKARGLQIAADAGIPTSVISPKEYLTPEAFGVAVFDACREAGAEYVVMGGFLSYVQIPPDFENRVLNIHPALIPAFSGKGFYGHRVHEAVLEYGAKVSGCTVHFVDNQYDHGPVILQKTVPVLDDDTPDTLAARVFAAECEAYPEALRLLSTGKVRVDGRRVITAR
ncbi:MAG: phosphoribosylglycinamide formyltransferase [Planctomycetota bacterium]|nr:MAG: phosphoribosylglycinamide formyltransferase [Planctomycetota bacterium]